MQSYVAFPPRKVTGNLDGIIVDEDREKEKQLAVSNGQLAQSRNAYDKASDIGRNGVVDAIHRDLAEDPEPPEARNCFVKKTIQKQM